VTAWNDFPGPDGLVSIRIAFDGCVYRVGYWISGYGMHPGWIDEFTPFVTTDHDEAHETAREFERIVRQVTGGFMEIEERDTRQRYTIRNVTGLQTSPGWGVRR